MRTKIQLVATLLVLAINLMTVHAQRERDLSTDARSLANTEWRLVSFGQVGAEREVSSTNVTLNFGADGRASGSGGCNSFIGSYRVRGDSISFAPNISTKRACLDSATTQQEQQFFVALGSANRFRLTTNRLSIFYGAASNVLSFVSESEPEPTNPDSDPVDDPGATLAAYYRAINARDFSRAYRYWETPNESLNQFTRGFADTEQVRFFFEPPARVEGAAGSQYAEIPTILIARRNRGGDRVFTGCYVMRKTNMRDGGRGVAGWRIYRANLSTTAGLGRLSPPASCQN